MSDTDEFATRATLPDRFAIQRVDTGEWLTLGSSQLCWQPEPKDATTWEVRPEGWVRRLKEGGIDVYIGRLPVTRQLV